MPFRGRPLIEYSIVAATRWEPLIVCSDEVALFLAGRFDIGLVRNDEPERGMAHSLSLANRAIEDDVAIGVLLADKPLVSEQLIETILHASHVAEFGSGVADVTEPQHDADVTAPQRGADVTYPERDGEPGHPVVLSLRARRLIDRLPPGDTLRFLRNNPELTARAVETDDGGAFFDVDTMDAFED